jgi:hypothetical protein
MKVRCLVLALAVSPNTPNPREFTNPKALDKGYCGVGGNVLADGDCGKLIGLFLRDCYIVPWYVRAIRGPISESWFGSSERCIVLLQQDMN